MTLNLQPLYGEKYTGSSNRYLVAVQYYTTSGKASGDILTYIPQDLSVEKAQDDSTFLAFTLPTTPAEGYYSIAVLDMDSFDAGYGEFKVNSGVFIPHTVPAEDDNAGGSVSGTLLDDETLKVLMKAREEARHPQPSASRSPKTADSTGRETQVVREVPGGTTASRDTANMSVPTLNVRYAELRSDAETKPVTIVGKNLPARENGYDLMVLETDMQGNPRGDAVSYTHVGADHLIGGKLEVAVGVPGSLLKTGSVYTAYLVYVDEQDNDTAVASVRFKVSAGVAQDTSNSPAVGGDKLDAATAKSDNSASASSGTSSVATDEGSNASRSHGAESAATREGQMRAERRQQGLQALAQVRTIAPQTNTSAGQSPLTSAYASGASATTINGEDGDSVRSGSASAKQPVTPVDGAKEQTPTRQTEINSRSAEINASTSQIRSGSASGQQEGVKAMSSPEQATEDASDYRVTFWAAGLVGLGLVTGAAWMAIRRNTFSLHRVFRR
ncbi:hypothetical protein [Rothia mucilaginosa]|uniref:hypothetical protein n=1 Tax=Rothia mucilaginosa TaxID=43675 RepID=UPI0028D4BF81|nr:hypothetical protein [Rothia mucilaginosa]